MANTFGITNIGGYRPGDPQEHGKGLAIDVMVPVGSDLGDQVAQFAIDNAASGNISYIIWEQKFWAPFNNIYGPALGILCLTVEALQKTTTITYIFHSTTRKEY